MFPCRTVRTVDTVRGSHGTVMVSIPQCSPVVGVSVDGVYGIM